MESRNPSADRADQGGQVVTLDDFGAGNPQAGVRSAAQALGDGGQLCEKRLDEGKQGFALFGEREGAAVEEGFAE